MDVVWAEYVTTSNQFIYHIKELYILKAWGLLY